MKQPNPKVGNRSSSKAALSQSQTSRAPARARAQKGVMVGPDVHVMQMDDAVSIKCSEEVLRRRRGSSRFELSKGALFGVVKGERVTISHVDHLRVGLEQGQSLQVRYVSTRNVKATLSHLEAAEWFAARLRSQIPPCFANDVAVTVRGEGRKP